MMTTSQYLMSTCIMTILDMSNDHKVVPLHKMPGIFICF